MSDLSIETNVGMLETLSGTLSVRCEILENGESIVHMYAFDSRDLRKSGAVLPLDHVKYKQLKELLRKVDDTIGRLQHSKRIMPTHSGVTISVSGIEVQVPKELYDEVTKMILKGETILAASKIQKSIQTISLAGAKEIAESICSHLRRTGERE